VHTALLVATGFAPALSTTVAQTSLIVQLFEDLEDSQTVPLRETDAPMTAMHACLAQVLEAFAVAGTPIQLPPNVTLDSVTTVYATEILNSLDATYGDVALMQRRACRDAVARAEAVDKTTRLAMTAVLAAACVSMQRLPDKVNTVIQPLMAGLRNIQEASLQKQVRFTGSCPPEPCACQAECLLTLPWTA
jgi:hypothetical protein